MIEITLFGTSSMVPTKERNQNAILLSYKSEGILIDCGEGTQRQFKQKGIPLTKITKILLTHWHGNHVFGLPGVISSLGAMNYQKTLYIYGPKGTKKHLASLFEAFVFDRRIELVVEEISSGVFLKTDEFSLECQPMEHGVPTLGYSFLEHDILHIDMKMAKKAGLPQGPLLGRLQDGKSVEWKGKKIVPEDVTFKEDGKKVVIVLDTAPCQNAIKLAKDADLLICEATYASHLEEKSREYLHMTGKDAGLIANQAGVKKLVLTHFSARYKDVHEVEEDARNVFDNVEAGKDFMVIHL